MRRLNKYLITVLCLLIFSGCSQTSNDVKQDDSPITMYVGLGNNQTYYENLKALVKEKLDIDIEFVYTNPIDTSTSVLLMFKNNNLPADIVATAAKIPEEYLKNTCVDLMSCSTIVDSFTYQKAQELTNDDGTIYQVPFTSRLIGITYNKTLMEEMGYEVPTNFEEMLALKKKCDQDGIVFSVSAMVATGHGFNYLFHLMGSEWISSLEGSKWFEDFLVGNCDSSALKEQSTYFKKWVDNGLFGICHDSDWQASKEYYEKRALFFFDLTSGIKKYENEATNTVDEFASIPWLSEDGSNNCYTYYDNMYLVLNNKLNNPENEDKREKCLQILDLLTTNEAVALFTANNYDGYISIADFVVDETRTYYRDKELVENGYLQPWYYNSFDTNTIVATGGVVNAFIKDGSKSFDDIFNTLDEYQTKYLNKKTKVLATVDRDLTIKETAILNGKCTILAYESEVDGSLVPYTDENNPLKLFSTYGVVNNIVYEGDFEENYIDTIVPGKGQKIFAVKLSGEEIENLLTTGLEADERNYPYVLVGIDTLDKNKEYTIAINNKSVNEDIYNSWLEDKKIIVDENEEVITYKIKDGFNKYFEVNKKIVIE